MPYRIIDEVAPGTRAPEGKTPWHPLGLFSLLLLSGPILPVAMLVVVLSALNWARLGFPERRWLWLGGGLLALLVPLVLLAAGAPVNSVRTALIFGQMGAAYAFLTAQRPVFEAHRARGGRTAGAGPLWGIAALLAAATLYLLFGTPRAMPENTAARTGNASQSAS